MHKPMECPFCQSNLVEAQAAVEAAGGSFDSLFVCPGCQAICGLSYRDDISETAAAAEDEGGDRGRLTVVGPVDRHVGPFLRPGEEYTPTPQDEAQGDDVYLVAVPRRQTDT